MAKFFEELEIILIDLWNWLYNFLCHIWDEEVNEDYIVDPMA